MIDETRTKLVACLWLRVGQRGRGGSVSADNAPPTGASIMACLMASVGCVTVSLRMSITLAMAFVSTI